MVLTAKQFADLMPSASELESDEPEMESSEHYTQLALLVSCLEFLWGDRQDFFIGANLTIFFSRQQMKSRDFRGPDFFLVKNTEKRPRKSWVVWEENGQYPDLIIELLSDSTADVDRTTKKELYQNRFRTLEYFWFSPETLELAGFRLQDGEYQPIIANENGLYWSESLGLFLGIYEQQLRYFTIERRLVPTPAESALEEKEKAFTAKQEAINEKQRADKLEAKLRELGIEID